MMLAGLRGEGGRIEAQNFCRSERDSTPNAQYAAIDSRTSGRSSPRSLGVGRWTLNAPFGTSQVLWDGCGIVESCGWRIASMLSRPISFPLQEAMAPGHVKKRSRGVVTTARRT